MEKSDPFRLRVLLTGRPGCGKTTVIRRAAELIGLDRCAGFYTEEVRERGRRVGFDVVTLDGRRGPLARAGDRGPRVSRYGVNVSAFERLGVEALEGAWRDGSRLLVVDEIGKMELFSERFIALLERIFDSASPQPLLGTVMERPHPLVDPLRCRPGVEVIQVSLNNREGLPGQLSEILGDYLEQFHPGPR